MKYSAGLFLNKETSLGWLDIWGFRTSSIFFRIHQYFDFIIINAMNAISFKHTLQDGRRMFSNISDTIENNVLTWSQNSFDNLYESQVGNSSNYF